MQSNILAVVCRQGDYTFKSGTVPYLSETVKKFEVVSEDVQQMEVA